ncbi:MAG: hypothetical protein ORN51_01635 [Akkermansiaceae bacterium]|nr:hypothetical protein [Akkermansiaceae bacterium]
MNHHFQRAGGVAALVIGAFLSTTVCHAEAKPDSRPAAARNKPQGQYPTATSNRAEITYVGDDTVFANPERGWFVSGELKPHGGNINAWATHALLKNYHAQGYRLAKHVVMIPTRSGLIPQSFFDDLQLEADLMRKHGFKVIYRFN